MSDESSSMGTTAPEPADQQRSALGSIGPYRLMSVLGEGGFGVVYLAEQTEPVRRRVALKVIKPGMDSRAVIARFEAERQALAMMDHPCVARVFDTGTTEKGHPYFAMEHVRGEPVTVFCDRQKLNVEARLDLFIRICEAVQHAHQKGVIHRDIKPNNILVCYEDNRPVPKVIDFGVAKALSQRLTDSTVFTEQGQMIGTPEYMSPEQAEMSATDIDTRSDIYSLGVLLYELLTGALPFDKKTIRTVGIGEVQRLIREVEPPKPSTKLSGLHRADATVTSEAARNRACDARTLVKRIRGDLDWIVLKCLEKDRTRRYETATALAADVRRYLNDEPVLACPPSTAYRMRKFVRRNKSSVIAASVVILALVGGLTAATVGLVQAQREAERARIAENRSELLRRLVRGGSVSLAVLPFQNASGDPEQDYFADGVTETIIAGLSKVRALHVVSDDSVMRYKGSTRSLVDIAQELNVDGVITGSVRKQGDRVRLSVQLTHALTSEDLWQENYEDQISRINMLQSRLSRDVAAQLELKLAPDEEANLASVGSVRPAAFEAYTKGRHTLRAATAKDVVMRALGFFDDAIRLDPSYAMGYIGRADAYTYLESFFDAPMDVMPQALQAARQALVLDDGLAEAHVALGLVLFSYEWLWEDARREFERALEIDPSNAHAELAMSMYLVAQNRPEEGMRRLERALELEPLSFLSIQDWFFATPFNAREFEQAVRYADMAFELDPSRWFALGWKGISLAMMDRFEEALAALEQARSIDDNPLIFVFLGDVYARLGNIEKAYEMIDILEEQRKTRYICPYEIATIYITLGDFDEVFRLMEEAIDVRSPCVPYFVSDPRLDPIRFDPRFESLVKRSGLQHLWPTEVTD